MYEYKFISCAKCITVTSDVNNRENKVSAIHERCPSSATFLQIQTYPQIKSFLKRLSWLEFLGTHTFSQ